MLPSSWDNLDSLHWFPDVGICVFVKMSLHVCLQSNRMKTPKGLDVPISSRHISCSSEGLKVQYWKSSFLFLTRRNPLLISTQIPFPGFNNVGQTIICYSGWVLVKLFVTRFHCKRPDYHHIAIVCWLKPEHLMKKKIWSVLKIPAPISASKRNQREP